MLARRCNELVKDSSAFPKVSARRSKDNCYRSWCTTDGVSPHKETIPFFGVRSGLVTQCIALSCIPGLEAKTKPDSVGHSLCWRLLEASSCLYVASELSARLLLTSLHFAAGRRAFGSNVQYQNIRTFSFSLHVNIAFGQVDPVWNRIS